VDKPRAAVNAALFLALFVVFLYLTFPYDIVRDTIVQKLESQGKVHVTIGDIEPFRLSGVRITDLKIADADDERKVLLGVDEARLRVRPTQLALGRVWVDFDIYAYGGGFAGSFCRRGGILDLAMNFADLRLAKYDIRELAKKYGQLDVDGTIGGDFSMHVIKGQRKGNSGALNLNLDRLRLANITMLGSTLPNIAFEPGKLSMELQHQQFKLNDFSLKGDNLSVQASGQVFVNEDTPKKSRVNLNVKFKPSDELEDGLGVLAMGLGEPDSDGYFEYRVNGPFDNLNTRSR
jgi:type II secretion system protein N